MSAVSLRQVEKSVAVIEVDNPPVNALSLAVREGLLQTLRAALADSSVGAIVIGAKGRTFMAGADIAEFGGEMKAPQLPEVVNAIEASTKPVVAALFGTVLGGGLEVALGCHYRVAAPDTRLGLPEVKLGLIPGAGGTQRLPRAVGAEAALEMILSGTPIVAAQAAKLGLVDSIADGEVIEAAVKYALDLIVSRSPPRRLGDQTVDPSSVPADLFERQRAALGRHPSGPVAPQACIAAVEAAVQLPFAQGLAREAELFSECYRSPYAAALWHVFFAERAAGTIPDLDRSVVPRKIDKVTVIGAGTMGSGIAMTFLNAGFPVTVLETEQAALDRGAKTVRGTYESAVQRGKLSAVEAQSRNERLTLSLDDTGLADADLVIEAVFESMAVKREVFARLDARCKPGAILATNTSTLDVDRIADATQRPGDVIGLHFFSPANIMRLLEVVRAERTSKDVMATAMAVAKRIGKVAVQARVCFGFIGNRMIEGYAEEATAILLEGATPAQVDGALERWGMAMGPFAMGDLAGLDVSYRIRRERQLTEEQKRLFAAPDALVEAGRHGQKTGKGFHRYAPGARKPEADPEVERIFAETATRHGIAPRKIDDAEIVERCLLRLVNEGARILEEGIALRAGDIDTVYVNGYGFPAWRGGPMWVADTLGLTKVVATIQSLHQRYGERWTLAPLLQRLAADGGSFATPAAKA